MKLNQIINESTDPKNPTDLTKNPLKPGNKYPANFYTGTKGDKKGKVVLGFYGVRGEFRTTGEIEHIFQAGTNTDVDNDKWIVRTEKNGVRYYYLIYMPIPTMKATAGWYLKGKNLSLMLNAPDGFPKDHMNLRKWGKDSDGEWSLYERDDLGLKFDWEYHDGTMIELAKRPPKPKNLVEAYNYLMYWAYSNNKAAFSPDKDENLILAKYLETGKRLKPGIREVLKLYPKAKAAVIAKLKTITEDPINAPSAPEAAAAAEQQAAPNAAAQAEEPTARRNIDDVSDEELENMSAEEWIDLELDLGQAAPAADPVAQATPEADQTTSNAAAETTNTSANHREFGGMPDNRGAMPTSSAKPPPADDGESEDDEHGVNPHGYTSRWAFEAMDSSGVEVKGSVDAATEEEATAKIRQMGYHVTKISDRARSRPQKSFWQRFVDGRTAKGLRKVFWPEK